MLPTTSTLLPLTALLTLVTAKNTVVKVGSDGLKFTPDNITGASNGDTLEFHFFPKNHSVVSSTFDKPCVPQEDAIFSGFMPVNAGDSDAKIFTVTLNDTSKPVWVYCSQGEHCQQGMVMAVNAPTTGNTLDAYKTASSKVAKSESPAGVLNKGTLGPASGSNSTSNSTSSGTATTTSGTSSTGTSSTSPSAATSNAAVLSNGQVSGLLGVLGGLMAFGML